jgi:hypothetical protein
MRFALALLGVLTVLAVSRTASAETETTSGGWAAPAVTIALLDGWRATSGQIDLKIKRTIRESANAQTGDKAGDKNKTADPGEELSAYVEQMWSQVRAYRRPGGAEFILRGKF